MVFGAMYVVLYYNVYGKALYCFIYMLQNLFRDMRWQLTQVLITFSSGPVEHEKIRKK